MVDPLGTKFHPRRWERAGDGTGEQPGAFPSRWLKAHCCLALAASVTSSS